MIDYSQAVIGHVVVHHVGSRAEAEDIRFSKKELVFQDDEMVSNVLLPFFFKSFKEDAYFNFTHEENLNFNPAFIAASEIFEDKSHFYDASINMAKLLYDNSNHPKIRGGEFYMVYISGVIVDGEMVDALGFFKSENKETFLKVYLRDQNFEVEAQEGINIKKIDKGCMIFNTEREEGFKVCCVDNLNKGQEARFWKDDFLGLQPREDNYYYTQNYMQMCKDFVGKVYNSENQVPRPDQIDMLNRSLDFFKENESFNQSDFETNVIQDDATIEAFNDYKHDFAETNTLPLQDEFTISKSAVNGEKKHFKSVVKLDKNFHIYIHGKREFVEKGYDSEKGLNFYTLYYLNEE